jgi:hypothetical protein
MNRISVKVTTLFFVLLLLAFVGGLSNTVQAQVDTGSISGSVHDTSGGLVPGATVTATNTTTAAERTTKTGSIGQYTLQGLPPANYKVRIASPNFTTFETVVEVTVGGALTVNAELQIGTSSTVVEVTAGAGTEVNTQTQELSQLVDTTQLASLPSLDRNPYDFVVLSGNVSNGDNTTASMSSSQTLSSRGVGYSINGQRQSGTEILLDGVENVAVFGVNAGQLVPADSIQEFSIITNNFGAEYGRASGGIVNVDTKVGGNSIHGSVFGYNRLSAYTANTFANDVDGIPKGTYTRNQFGYNAGGPIIKNKLFVSFSEEFTRVRSAASETEDVFDPAFISLLPANVQSYFSTYAKGVLPSSSSTTAGQLVSAGLFSTNTFPLINGVTPVPLSTPVFDTVNFSAPFDAGGGVPQNTYNLVGRLDFNASSRTQMFFRFARYSENDFQGAVSYSPYPQYNTGDTALNNSALFSISHSFTNSLLSNTKASFTRFNVATSFDTSLTSTPNLYLNTTSAQSSNPLTGNIIQMPGLQNTTSGTGGLPFGGPQNTFQLEQDLAWTKGRHTMRYGGEFTYIQLNVAYGAYTQAVEALGADLPSSFNSLVNSGGITDSTGAFASPIIEFTGRVNPNGALPCALDTYGNPILTPACTVAPPLSAASPARSYRYKDWALYAQDSFKLTRRLTINYGLRYEHYGVQHNDIQSLDSNFYPGAGGPGVAGFADSIRNGNVLLTTQSPIGQFWAPRWGTPAPRVGFAYDVFGDGKTALRGGFGISYERNFGNVTYNASFNPPASAAITDLCNANAAGVVTTCPYTVTNNSLGPLGSPGPATALSPVELRDNDANVNVAQTQFWSLALEHQLAANTILALSYSGAHSVHLYDIANVNMLGAGQAYLGDPLVTGTSADGTESCPYSNPTTGTPTCYTRLNSQYADINRRSSDGVGSYNALNVKFQTQNLHHTGVTIVANYTWSHSLDDLSDTFSGSESQGSLGYTDPTHPQLDYGNSDGDVRHRFVVSPIWQTPWFKSGRGFLSQALGGWNISGIYTVRTGIPFSVYDLTDLLNYTSIPRLIPSTPITSYNVGTPVQVGPNQYTGLVVPAAAMIGALNPTLGISDFGPFPANMTGRNAFRGPGAWNFDAAIQKEFKLTERFGLVFRAEGFDVFNHHNFYVNAEDNYTEQGAGPVDVTEEKGGLGNGALGGNHDERRFGQFSLRLTF